MKVETLQMIPKESKISQQRKSQEHMALLVNFINYLKIN